MLITALPSCLSRSELDLYFRIHFILLMFPKDQTIKSQLKSINQSWISGFPQSERFFEQQHNWLYGMYLTIYGMYLTTPDDHF